MKKTGLILLFVVVLVAVVFYLDKKTRQPNLDVPHTALAASGNPEPAVNLKDLDGKDITLTDYKGKVVLVNFWATWCDPCLGEIPDLIQLQQKFGPRGFTVLGVAMDEEGKSVVAPFVAKERFDVDGQKQSFDYPIVIGNEDVADKFGGLLGYPTSVLISRDGKQVKRITGPISEDELSKAIESLL
ncbi:MAG TPA: TlpA disulfide reductase family protein [Terriglobales bacterium]|nr:TlpA disulfide reductase family protein [Terriglobales bacterium]